VIRVSGTRVTLDSILLAFNDGATPEEIAQKYPTVPLADIYHLIGYYLRHTREMEEYVRGRIRVAGSAAAERGTLEARRRSPTFIGSTVKPHEPMTARYRALACRR
jgi:uncharacterized protein (DUF433 family)